MKIIVCVVMLVSSLAFNAAAQPLTVPTSGVNNESVISKHDPLKDMPSFTQVLKNLGIIIGLALIGAALLKYKQNKGIKTLPRSIKIIEKIRLTHKSSLVKVQDGKKIYTVILGDEQGILLSTESEGALFSEALIQATSTLKT